MKRMMLALALLSLATGMHAQDAGNGWRQQKDREQISIDSENQTLTIDHNTYAWVPLDATVAYSIYGSRFRKAKMNRNWGVFLSCVAAPASAVLMLYGIGEGIPGAAIAGGGMMAGCLGGGIPLWVRGRRGLDWILDDYAERYGPKPYAANLTVGPTPGGVGLALRF